MDADQLKKAFSELEVAIQVSGPGAPISRRPTLRLIAALNQEIGRAAYAEPLAAPSFRVLQGQVNAVTIAVKSGRDSDARSALSEARRALRDLLKSFRSA